MVTVMVLLFAAMILVRRRQMLAKKTMTPSRSNGAVLTTPLSGKHEAPLWLDKASIPDYVSSTLPEYSKLNSQEYSRVDYNSLNLQNEYVHQNGNVNLHQNPLEYTVRPDRLDYANSDKNYSRKYKDFGSMQVQEYASPNLDESAQIADYAEVDPNAAMRQSTEATSPAPYATTTLVTGRRRMGNSLVCNTMLINILLVHFTVQVLSN